jgi:hypothetical protein
MLWVKKRTSRPQVAGCAIPKRLAHLFSSTLCEISILCAVMIKRRHAGNDRPA